jgi:hypothetical protein
MKDIKKGFVDSLLTLPSFSFVRIIFGIYGMKQGLGVSENCSYVYDDVSLAPLNLLP